MELTRENFSAMIFYDFPVGLTFQQSHDRLISAFRSAVTQENTDAVELIMDDRHVTYHEIQSSLGISGTTIQKILHDELWVRSYFPAGCPIF